MKKTLLIVVLKTFLSFNSFSQDFLNSSLINFLKSPEISNSIVGLQLQNQNGKILLSNNPKKSLIPASLQKLFTTAYVLNKLPLDFTFKTLVLSNGLIDTNTNILYGNLIISTSGDPSLESRIYKSRSFIKDLRLLMLKLQIKSIEGKVILKPLETDYQVNNQWLWSDLGNYYGSGYSSHTFRDNYVEVFFNSGKEIGEPTEIIKIDPKIDSFHLINKVIVGESNRDLSCAYGAPLDENRLVIGTIPANKENFKVKISMHNPKIFLQYAIENILLDLGITINNSTLEKNTLTQLDTLMIYESPTINDLVMCVNSQSNNNYAEHILIKAVSKIKTGVTLNQAPAYLEDFWKDKLGVSSIVFKDGCGLSRMNLSTPHSFNKLMNYQLNQSSVKEAFFNSLPVSGKSGTLKYIGNNTILEGKFIGKSGSMGGVRCYSGCFVKNSKYFPFTIMINNFTSKDYLIKSKIESLMIDIYKNI